MLKALGFCTFIALFFVVFFGSCRKDDINNSPALKLSFSTDTIFFDTVFTSVGSYTQKFKIYNTSNSKIVISSVSLGLGSRSNFTFNIDGLVGNNIKEIEIDAKDSLHGFIEVTVDPNNGTSPLVISDSLVFVTNGNQQDIKLVAWGQDAYYHRPKGLGNAYVLNCNEVWKNDKPHVVYGYAVVDSLCTLTVTAGTQVHFHAGSGLIVYNQASLHVEGQKDREVVFQGDRLSYDYREIPGQWNKIWLSPGSKGNIINYAIIKNGTIGLQVDTLGDSNPTLIIKNSIIKNMAFAGIYAQGSNIYAENIVVANCAKYCNALTLGGNYAFLQCTFANFYYDFRKTPSILLNDNYKDVNGKIQRRPITANFGNCIIYGSQDEEIGFDFLGKDTTYSFVQCLVNRSYRYKYNLNKNFQAPIIYSGTDSVIFKNYIKNVFELREGSPAIDKGSETISSQVPLDINGKSRIIKPDIGAYEFQP